MPEGIRSSLAGGLAEVRIDHPAKLNALTVAMWRELKDTFEELATRDDLRCVVVRGAGGKAFSAGADIGEFEATRASFDQVVQFHEEVVGGGLAAVFACPVPVVAAIEGACFGGGLEIASVCDLRIAAASARFGAPVGRLGFPLAFAETQALVRWVGPAVAAELLIEGRIFDAQEACRKGLVARVVEDECLDEAVETTVRNITASGAWASRSHKRQIRRIALDPTPVTLEERMREYAFAETEEYRSGYRRFLAKSRPE